MTHSTPSSALRTAAAAGAHPLPPVRPHDLRHGAATLALAGGANLEVVPEMLGHLTLAISADTDTDTDTDTDVLPAVAQEAAGATAR